MIKEMTFGEFKKFSEENTIKNISITDEPYGTQVRIFDGYIDINEFLEIYKDKWGEKRVVDHDGIFVFIYNKGE